MSNEFNVGTSGGEISPAAGAETTRRVDTVNGGTHPEPTPALSRRQLLATGSMLAGGVLAAPGRGQTQKAVVNGRIRQSVCQWCYGRMPLDDLCAAAAAIGLESVELLGPESFDTVKKHGLTCAVVNSHTITRGINDPANHAECLGAIRSAIDAAADAGFPNVITFSGNRTSGNGTEIPDDVGLDNSVVALKQVIGQAEMRGVTIIMELLNSRVDHADYMADNMPWLVELVNRVGSDRFKILYDIYHAQIQEGDVIRTIQTHSAAIGHYHTAGNPGRHELDDRQELQYPAIVRAIIGTGYTGFLGQEFIPTGDPLTSLAEAVHLCDV